MDRERHANQRSITHRVKRSAAKPSASPGDVKADRLGEHLPASHCPAPRQAQDANQRPRKPRMPNTANEFPLLGRARSLRPPTALDDAQINPICFARALDRRDHRDVQNGGYPPAVTGWSTTLCAIWHFSASYMLRLTVR